MMSIINGMLKSMNINMNRGEISEFTGSYNKGITRKGL